MKKDIYIVAIFFTLGLLMISCSSSDEKESQTTGRVAQGQVQTAATGSLNLKDIDGNPWEYEDYKGKQPMIINFWGTWCPPCRHEMPDLKKIYDEYNSKGLEIVGIAVNDTPGKVRAYAEKGGYEWVMLMTSREASRFFKLGAGVPTTIFIDRDGNETGRYVGMRTYKDFKTAVEGII
jgi:thiol-disulfide isomerase/thioredoxin